MRLPFASDIAKRVPTDSLPHILTDWFATRSWEVRRHQHEMLAAARAGRDALLVAPTGSGKTLAGFLPSLAELVEAPTDGLHTLYVSPLKALAVDVQRNLLGPIDEMGLGIRVETRSGDTPSDRKARQRVKPPQILLTTPESLSLLLSYPDSFTMFAGLRTIVIDEVQRRPDLFPVLRVLADRRKNPARMLILGSASGELMRQSSESLAGRAEHIEIGGFTLSEDGRRLVVVSTEDNLLKGAATQALQNLNIAFGLDEWAGIPLELE